jgi:hypothetical protein
MIAPNHLAASPAEAFEPNRSANAGPPTNGNNPISKPSNIQPSNAAVSAIQRPRLLVRCGASPTSTVVTCVLIAWSNPTQAGKTSLRKAFHAARSMLFSRKFEFAH